MKLKYVTVMLFVAYSLIGKSQNSITIKGNKNVEELTRLSLGIEFQAYPAGQMYGLRGEYFINKKSELNLRIGYNRAFRYDFSGLNDNEQGGGWGFTPGYRHHFTKGLARNFFVGARCDFWWLSIDWIDEDNIPRTGNTQITVVQPTIELGYTLRFGINNGWRLTPAIAFGQEINVVTNGDEVGQGGISLVGVSFSRRLF